jgi:hypothetical protein
MATARPFAYNPGPQISGTEQIGDLSIGTPTSGFTSTPQYWNGPDEELGYVIAQSVSGNTQPSPLSGVTASVGFFRSPLLTEQSFVEYTNSIFGQSFSDGSSAVIWLNANGYWTSFVPSITPSPTPTNTNTPTPTNTPTVTVTPTNTSTSTTTPTPTPSTPSGSVTGGTGTEVAYATGTLFDAYSSRDGITTTDAFNTNNGCWQLYYAHQEIDMNSGTGNIGLNPHTSGTNSWTWYYAISNSINTIGNWGSVLTLSAVRSGSYTCGVFTTSNINTNVTIPANTYFLIGNSSGPFYRTVKSLADNRTATVGGLPFVTAVNKVCLGNWPSGGTTGIPIQFGGATAGYTFYGSHSHVHSVTFN